VSQSQRMVFLGLSLGLLLVLGWLTTGSLSFIYQDFWFFAGLLLLLLLSVVDQPHFSKDSHIFLNGVTGLLALLTVTTTQRSKLWFFFFAWCFYLVASSYALMLRRSAPLPQEAPSLQLISRVNRAIGRPEAVFSAFFLWGIYTRFTPQSWSYAALMWFWAAFMIMDLPAVSNAISTWISTWGSAPVVSVGRLTGFVSPRIVEAELSAGAPDVALGRRVEIAAPSGVTCATAVVIDDRILAGRRRIRMGITQTAESWHQLATHPPGAAGIRFLPPHNDDGGEAISVVDVGSDISSLKVNVPPDVQLDDGELLWTVLADTTRAHYQVVSARITESTVSTDHGIHQLAVTASQLGKWNAQGSRFDPVTWVAPPGGIVFKGAEDGGPHPIPIDCLRIGTVPGAAFPVHLRLEDVVTHNTAILGVTGSGKSFLCLQLIKGLIAHGVKVLVLDITRQYWSILATHQPTAIHNPQELTAWLQGNGMLGVHQFANSPNFTQTTAQYVDACFRHLRDTVALQPGTNEPARLCIVFEEAHSLIPEWNQVAERNDPENVNRTSRSILQGRKYGLGSIIVSQRTANVTKTILNQCNTIAALQCFDQTGLEFLRNYMGEEYASALSQLPAMHAVVVGKASSSARPVRVAFDDFPAQWRAADLQAQAPPAPAPDVPAPDPADLPVEAPEENY